MNHHASLFFTVFAMLRIELTALCTLPKQSCTYNPQISFSSWLLKKKGNSQAMYSGIILKPQHWGSGQEGHESKTSLGYLVRH